MKLSKFVSLLVIAVLLTAVGSGCRKKPVGITPIPKGSGITGVQDPGRANPIGTDGETGGKTTSEPSPLGDPGNFANHTRDAEIFKQDMVFFAYDSSVVRSGEKSKVARVADHLKGNPGCAVEVDGHCDERGTEEYNRSLGMRRALSVRDELTKLGVDPAKVITQTFGKDRPLEPLHSEDAWSKNRRGEFILLTPPK